MKTEDDTRAEEISAERWAECCQKLGAACEGLLNGLDANTDDQAGLTHEQWLDAIRDARAALDFWDRFAERH